MISHDHYQALLVLNKSSSQFPDNLRAVLNRQGFDEDISKLQTGELAKIIDYLDEVPSLRQLQLTPTEPNLPQALNGLDHTSGAFRQILRKLQGICTSRMCLPSSYISSTGKLNTDKSPFASGGFSDVFKGTYDGSVVCVKRLRVASTSSMENITKGFIRCDRLFAFLLMCPIDALPRSFDMEMVNTRQHRPLQRCNSRTSSDYLRVDAKWRSYCLYQAEPKRKQGYPCETPVSLSENNTALSSTSCPMSQRESTTFTTMM